MVGCQILDPPRSLTYTSVPLKPGVRHGEAASRSWVRVLASLAPSNHQDHAMPVHPAGREAW
jgi:hypothetical protein